MEDRLLTIMCNKTIIIRFGFGDIWNNQDRDKKLLMIS